MGKMLGFGEGAAARHREFPFVILVAVFFSCFLTWRPSEEIMFTLSDALFILGFFVLVLRHRIPLEPLRFFTPFWYAGFAMMVTGLLVGSVHCPAPDRWPIVAGQYLFAWIILPMIMLRRNGEQTEAMLRAYVWGVFAMNLFGAIIYFKYTGSFDDARRLLGVDFLTGGRRLGAFTADANWNGAVLAMAIPVVFFLRAKERIGDLLAIVWLGVLGLGVLLTASFTAFVGGAAAVVMFIAVGGIRFRPRTWVMLAAALILAIAIFFETGAELPQTFVARVGNAITNRDISEAGTFEGRMDLIREAWGLVKQHMVVGLGADQYRVVSVYSAPVHNMYLLLWAEGGLISMFGWTLMVAVMFAIGIKAYGRDRLATALTLSTATTFLIASTASPHMYARLWSVPVILALAVSIEVARNPAPAARRKMILKRAGAAV